MLTLKAPAKINWFLKILGLRDDGFHEIQSLMQKISLYDVLKISPADDLSLKTEGSIAEKDNLVYRAAALLKSTYSVNEGACMELHKNIPVGAGLGGGSSDAAAALMGLNQLWSLGLSSESLSELAARIGSDVPFFLYGPASFVYGRGEKMTPCKNKKKLYILLVKPPFAVSTAWAYKNFQSTRLLEQETQDQENSLKLYDNLPKLTKKREKVNNIKLLIRNIEEAHFSAISGSELNDLESVLIREFHVIAEIKDRLRRLGAVFSLMSGSGSTVFGVFRSENEAEAASGEFQDFWTAAVHTITD
ncbi:MAG: 4-(cytidine 5'-diphospho)-2-C-methyl-D-erythritol kinase [Nitrospiraceae bacterium]|nr:MAG: 4-(cytidine 5'-diphospho)-2-C-methyl-D-erythritol kinase [Nitrospiraceae bacterium]